MFWRHSRCIHRPYGRVLVFAIVKHRDHCSFVSWRTRGSLFSWSGSDCDGTRDGDLGLSTTATARSLMVDATDETAGSWRKRGPAAAWLSRSAMASRNASQAEELHDQHREWRFADARGFEQTCCFGYSHIMVLFWNVWSSPDERVLTCRIQSMECLVDCVL